MHTSNHTEHYTQQITLPHTHNTRLYFKPTYFFLTGIYPWLVTNKERSAFPSENNCQGQLLTPQSVTILVLLYFFILSLVRFFYASYGLREYLLKYSWIVRICIASGNSCRYFGLAIYRLMARDRPYLTTQQQAPRPPLQWWNINVKQNSTRCSAFSSVSSPVLTQSCNRMYTLCYSPATKKINT